MNIEALLIFIAIAGAFWLGMKAGEWMHKPDPCPNCKSENCRC